MATKKAKNPSFNSPKGIFRYPAITKPDYGTDEFPKPDGELKVQLVLTQEVAQELIDKLQPIHDAAVQEGEQKFAQLKVEQRKKLKELKVNELYAVEYDKETEEPTGNVIFKFATAYSGVNDKGEKWTRKVPVFDAKGKPFTPKAIFGGTVGKVSFEAAPYFVTGQGMAGVKLYLSAVQVIELRDGVQKDAAGYGFGEEEGLDSTEASNGFGFGDETGGESQAAPQDQTPDF